MRKKATTKRPYFTMKSAMTAILRDASGKMHHGILFARRLTTVEGDRGAGARENRGWEGNGRREKKGREVGSL